MVILIAGGSGLIGMKLSRRLRDLGHMVRHLSRSSSNNGPFETFQWNPAKSMLDMTTLEDVDAVVNLAGTNLNSRWSPEVKSQIVSSRLDSTRCLHQAIAGLDRRPKCYVSASAVGIYPSSYTKVYTEQDPPAEDFLGKLTVAWEREAWRVSELGVRTVMARIGIVLSADGGALPELKKTIAWGLGAPLGSGKQKMSWIHIDDIVNQFVFVITNEQIQGACNFVGPAAVTNTELTRQIAKVLNRPIILPPIPEFMLKLILGEMSAIVLSSQHASNAKIANAGFTYTFDDLGEALKDLLIKKAP